MFLRKILPAAFLVTALLSTACHHPAHVTAVDVQYAELNKQDTQSDPGTEAIIHLYKDSLDKLMNVVVGHSDVAMSKERDKPETLLGNFVCDLSLLRVNAIYRPADKHPVDFCLMNIGGLRSSLPQGDLTRGNIFELMPFDNELDIVTLSGKQTWELLRFVAMSGGEPIAGIKIGVKADKTPGTVLIQGQAFDSTKTYKVVTSDYLANGGDKMDFFKNPLKLETTGYKIRDAILDYCQAQTAAGKTLTAKTDGRFYYETK